MSPVKKYAPTEQYAELVEVGRQMVAAHQAYEEFLRLFITKGQRLYKNFPVMKVAANLDMTTILTLKRALCESRRGTPQLRLAIAEEGLRIVKQAELAAAVRMPVEEETGHTPMSPEYFQKITSAYRRMGD